MCVDIEEKMFGCRIRSMLVFRREKEIEKGWLER